MHATLRNLGPKLVWLRLNSGEYLSIPARGSRSVDQAKLERNPAYEKLLKRGVLAVVEAKPETKAPVGEGVVAAGETTPATSAPAGEEEKVVEDSASTGKKRQKDRKRDD